MKATAVVFGVLALFCGLAGALTADDTAKTVWSFEDDTLGEAAVGFKTEVGRWEVAELDGGKVLSQTAKNANSTFNVAFASDTRAKDLDLAVKMQARAGDIDQGGGLVWRVRDKNNYYLARYNPLEDNYRLCKVRNGKRTMLKNADIKATPGWHSLRVTMKGEHIECFLDGKKYLEVDDTTFPEAGLIGLWSKADAQSYFDDLTLLHRSTGWRKSRRAGSR
ncbi:MAG TPA: family 16 glycoside hydrolase [Pirellulales bacterium]|nr:family 16 glycoside hydrolase [Pirellulales bacterium]